LFAAGRTIDSQIWIASVPLTQPNILVLPSINAYHTCTSITIDAACVNINVDVALCGKAICLGDIISHDFSIGGADHRRGATARVFDLTALIYIESIFCNCIALSPKAEVFAWL
jgi:hypothetical protein